MQNQETPGQKATIVVPAELLEKIDRHTGGMSWALFRLLHSCVCFNTDGLRHKRGQAKERAVSEVR